ncbi:MAG: glycosyltransferase [Xenococcaceae cyanobacterium]
MTTPVTVLMSVYNGMPYLKDAIDSILQQTFTDFKFLIFDDASTDGTSQILVQYAQKDNRIQIVTNDRNYGLGANLARGVEMAKTPWIGRMDADDVAVPNRLEMQVKYINAHPEIDILGGYVTDIDENGAVVGERRFPESNEEIQKLVWTCPVFHPTVMLRREAILKVGSYSPKLRKRQDYELWFRCVAANLKFANLTTPLIYYRFSDNTFKRNNWRVQLTHLSIGWRGCWLVGASPCAYLGVTKPLVISLLPPSLRSVAYRWLKKFDPRERASN